MRFSSVVVVLDSTVSMAQIIGMMRGYIPERPEVDPSTVFVSAPKLFQPTDGPFWGVLGQQSHRCTKYERRRGG